MWNGKNKAVTFSFDDGVVQDIRFVKLLEKYGLKCTFNINSGTVGTTLSSVYKGRTIIRDRILPKDFKSIYQDHEVAVHTMAHPDLTINDKETIIYQVEQDRKILSDLCGYEVIGMAYPGGGINHDDRVVDIVKNYTGVKYARGNGQSLSLDVPKDLFDFDGTAYVYDKKSMFKCAEEFLSADANTPKLLYVWGHTYEFDFDDYITWQDMEEFCKLIANQKDVFYGTNKEILLNKGE